MGMFGVMERKDKFLVVSLFCIDCVLDGIEKGR